MTTDFRALCEELTRELAQCWPRTFDVPDVLGRARAALAQPEPEVVKPTDEDLALIYYDCSRGCEFMDQGGFEDAARAVLARWGNYPAKPDSSIDGPAVPEGRELAAVAGKPSDEELLELTEDWPATTGPRHDLSGCPEVPLYSVFADEVVDFARAVLARWGRPAPAHAEPEISAEEAAMIAAPWSYLNPPQAGAGEVAELVAWLHGQDGGIGKRAIYSRIAALLQRQAAPVPVPVSERLPGAEDCDAEGQVWVSHEPPEWDELTYWTLTTMDRAMMWAPVAFWLPAHALPLPTTEPQP